MYKIGNGEWFLIGHFPGGECLIENTREQISAFIMAAQEDVVIANIHGDIEITTFFWFLNKVTDQAFVPELQEVLVPQQISDIEPIPFVPFEYPKELGLIEELFERGYKRVHLELSKGPEEHLNCYIEDKPEMWLLTSDDNWEKPIEADSIVELAHKMEETGWTSFRVTETIKAEAEDAAECICGNTVDSDGFYPCDSQGREVEPIGNWDGLTICARCGLMFRNDSYDPIAHTYRIEGVGEFVPLED